MEPKTIEIRNARQHNLKSVSLSLPRNALIVFTGVSGSGKSSLAFDTLYAEGQRRYIESLSSYARQFMGQMEKPDCDLIAGLSPSIAIEQKTAGWNPRSTVGTITGVHDFLRVLYARVGTQHCPACGRRIEAQSREQIVEGILRAFAPDPNHDRQGADSNPNRDREGAAARIPARRDRISDITREGIPAGIGATKDSRTRKSNPNRDRKEAVPPPRAETDSPFQTFTGETPIPQVRSTKPILILAPIARGQKGEFRDTFDELLRTGYARARVDGRIVELRDDLALVKNQRHNIEVVIDRLIISAGSRTRLAEAVEGALRVGQGTLIVAGETPKSRNAETPQHRDAPGTPGTKSQKVKKSKSQNTETASPQEWRRPEAEGYGAIREEKVFSAKYACPECEESFEPPTPQMFSFNAPAGMCLTCDGLGELFDFDPDLLVPDPTLNFWAPCVAPLRVRVGKWRQHIYEGVARAVGFDITKPWKDLPEKARGALLYGTGDRHLTYEWRWSRGVWKHGGTFDGVIAELREKYRKAKAPFIREYYEKYMRRGPCPDCRGGRLNEQALAMRIAAKSQKAKKSKSQKVETLPARRDRNAETGAVGPNIQELCAMSVAQAYATLGRLVLTPVQQIVAEDVLKEIRGRLEFLLNVGLHYLTLDRGAPTLSGGELQRIRLAGQIGSGLVGVLYILDEPSIGLHARDNEQLLASLQKLRDLGNTVIVVEHDEATMRAADHIVDFGPGPGVRGGKVVAEGTLDDVLRCEESLTGRYLSGYEQIPIPARRSVPSKPPAARGRRSAKRDEKRRD